MIARHSTGARPTRLISIIAMLLVSIGTAHAQPTQLSFEEKFFQSTLDSAIRYELLKPVVISLQKENFFLVKQVAELRMANDLRQRLADQVDRDHQLQLADIRKRYAARRHRRLIIVYVAGVATKIIIDIIL